MFKTLAHAGHSHEMTVNGLSEIDHCAPIVIGSGIVIVVLLLVIFYFLASWEPKTPTKSTKKTSKK